MPSIIQSLVDRLCQNGGDVVGAAICICCNDEFAASTRQIIGIFHEDFAHLRFFDRIAQAIGTEQIDIAIGVFIEIRLDFDGILQADGSRSPTSAIRVATACAAMNCVK